MWKYEQVVEKFVDKCGLFVESFEGCGKVEKFFSYPQFFSHKKDILFKRFFGLSTV